MSVLTAMAAFGGTQTQTTPADQARLRALRETIANAGTQEGLKLAVL